MKIKRKERDNDGDTITVKDTPFYPEMLAYCEALVDVSGEYHDFPGTAEELTEAMFKKASKNSAFSVESHHSVLSNLEQMARYLAIDRITIDLIKVYQTKSDFETWERIVNLNYDILLHYCRKLVQGELRTFRGDAEDVVHVAFLKAQSKINHFKANQCSSLQPWLQRMAKNWIVDETRKQANRSVYIDDLSANTMNTESPRFEPADTGHAGPVTALNQCDKKDQVDKALGQLTTKSAIIIRSHDGEKRSMRQIAEDQKLTIDKVKYRLQKARAKVKSILSNKDLETK